MADLWLMDLGSSRVKWQVRSDAGLELERGAWSVDAAPVLPETSPAAVWLSRVGAPEREVVLRQAIRDRHGWVPIHSVRAQTNGPAGLHLGYDCHQLGADRYCVLLGVLGHTRAPAVVIDAGTAVTIDLLGADGLHLGGYILPGFRLGLAAVSALLPSELRDQVAPVLEQAPYVGNAASCNPGQDTGQSLMRGWTCGLAGALQGLGGSSGGGVGGDVREWWLTGGDSPWLAALLAVPCRVDRDLIFDGLWLCAQGGVRDEGRRT